MGWFCHVFIMTGDKPELTTKLGIMFVSKHKKKPIPNVEYD